MSEIQSLGQQALGLLMLALIGLSAVLLGMYWFGWWATEKRGSLSIYTKQPMMLGHDLPFSVRNRIQEFLGSLPQPDNAPFDCAKAAVCRETGRIFPDCVYRGIVRLNWNFFNQRYPGKWVSWGSLDRRQKALVSLCHRSMDGYQVDCSCPNALPKDIFGDYIMAKPGPLYVDMGTKALLGWKIVPETYFEVPVVQFPDVQSTD
jgi:hypothetical protein